MANTFDTSRVGGGTYELEQDASGNYNLKSVGFKQVNKLNLPDLKTSDTTSVADTTKKATEDTIKAQTTEVFTPMNTYGGGADQQDTSTPMLKTADVNKPTVRNVGDPMTNIAYGQTQDIKAGQTKADQAAPQESVGATDSIQPQYQDGILRGQTGVKYSKPPSIKSRATSAVQDTVSVVIDSVKSNKALQMSGRVLGAIVSPSLAGAKMIAGSLTNSYQRDINKANKDALTSLGYKTNYELGIMKDPGRVAGNPADDVFAGMNAVSAFGDISKGAQSRLDTRNSTKTQERMAAKSKEKQAAFKAKTAEMQKQKDAHDQAAARDRDNAQAARDNRSKDSQGNNMGGSCFIAGTKVTMSDGTLKNIENIVVGDKVKGHKEDNTVIKLDPTLLADRKLYSFNNNEHYFFTSEHPFMTEEGWKSIKPEKTKERDGIELYNQLKGELKVGDKLVTDNDIVEIKDIKSKEINNPDMPLYNFNVSNDSSYIADDYVVHNKGCFIKGTLVTMADGSTKPVEQVDLGDEVAEGGSVFAVGRFLNTELYDYKGVKVSGSHMVNEDNVWMRVKDTKHGKSLGDDLNTVYVFGSENRRILINGILFTDYFEVNEQDQLINNEKDFFNNWKSYGNTIDEHNVNTLNAS